MAVYACWLMKSFIDNKSSFFDVQASTFISLQYCVVFQGCISVPGINRSAPRINIFVGAY